MLRNYLLLSLIFGILLSYTTLGSIPVANAADMSVDIKCVERTLVIKILGKDGQPLENAKVRTLKSMSTQSGFVNQYQTDAAGIIELKTGSNTGYVWISKAGYNDQKTKVPYCNVASTINDLSDFSIDMNCSDNVLILKVFTKSKTPIPNAKIITYDSFNQYSNEFRTDEKGILELRPVFNTGKISITKIGYNIQTLNTINCVVSENQYVSQTTPSEKIPSPTIPSWIKNNAKWWADGTITESDFLKGVEHLIQNKIIKVSTVSQSSSQEPVPEWVKNNAKWWADGMIDDKAFYQGIEFLANNGILNIKIEEKVITKSQLKQFFPSKTSKDGVYTIEELREELEVPGYFLLRINDQYVTSTSLSIFNEKNFSKSNWEFEIKDYIIGNPIFLKNAKGLCYQTFQILEDIDNNGFSCLVDNVRIDIIAGHMENLSTINYAKSNLNQILQKIGDYNSKKIELVFNQSTQVTIDETELVKAETFLVYDNNLNDDYKIKEFVKLDTSVFSEQNMFLYKGKYEYLAVVEKGITFTDFDKQKIKLLESSDEDKTIFTLPMNYGLCVEINNSVGHNLSCNVDGWIFLVISIEEGTPSEPTYELMDVMLQKYYYNKDSEFTQSTKELVKSGTFVAKKEKTYDEIINSLVEVNVISCSVSTNYVNWKGSVTSLANQPIDVFLILSGVDRNGKIVTFVEEIILDLYPGQTEYLSRLIDDVSSFNECSYKLERVQLSN
jgi:hypothetical protein